MATIPELAKALHTVGRQSWRSFLRKHSVFPPVGDINFGDFGGTEPVSRSFGLERGEAIDRYYIADFLHKNAADIHGVCLEVAEDRYTRQFGDGRVVRADTLHYDGKDTAGANTVIGDLSNIPQVADASYDCFIITQTLQYIYDPARAAAEIFRILKPGGICLCTASGITQISSYDQSRWGEYWRFTQDSLSRLFENAFGGQGQVRTSSYGNVYAATAFLQGLSLADVERAKLDVADPAYQLLVCTRAEKTAQ
jgi:SAM-dependent methyltransferase